LRTSDSNLSFSYFTTNFVSPDLVVFGDKQVKWVFETIFALTEVLPNIQIISRVLSNLVPQTLTSVPPLIGPLRG